ncbi:MAG TPA: JAB domain-containing protein [Bacillota bacterium]
MISLNAKRRINGIHIIGVGSLDQVNVEPREVFAAALMNNAAAIIAFHNHPSGDPVPSPADFAITRRLQEAGEIMNIRVLDHLVIGEGRFYSMREGGSL